MSRTFFGAKCDIYIGTGAGKNLLEEMEKATEEIKIISPYLSPSLVNDLIYLHHQGKKINLITINDIEDTKDKENIRRLIKQVKITDANAEVLRKKWLSITKILLSLIILITISTILAYVINKDLRFFYLVVPLTLFVLISKFYNEKITSLRIYSYEYVPLFPFKVLLQPEEGSKNHRLNLHSKIYIIDNKIAYLGSLNFTHFGTKSNHETSIRTTDRNAILYINSEFDSLLNNEYYEKRDLQEWGKSLYDEPIN